MNKSNEDVQEKLKAPDCRWDAKKRTFSSSWHCSTAIASRGDSATESTRPTVTIKQLVEDFARYLYLPRLTAPTVLLGAIRDGLGLLLWQQDSFAFADSFDEAAGRYRGLRCGQHIPISEANLSGLLVRPDVARKQQDSDTAVATGGMTREAGSPETTRPGESAGATTGGALGSAEEKTVASSAPTRFHGSVTLEPTRVGRDAGRIADEVIAHLAGLVDSTVKVTLDIEAEIPSGAPDSVVRTVTENSRTLKFTSHGFEAE